MNTDKYYFIFEDDVELVPEIKRENFLQQLNKDIEEFSKTHKLKKYDVYWSLFRK